MVFVCEHERVESGVCAAEGEGHGRVQFADAVVEQVDGLDDDVDDGGVRGEVDVGLEPELRGFVGPVHGEPEGRLVSGRYVLPGGDRVGSSLL